MKIDFDIHGLKCDNPHCDYCNPKIPFEDYSKYLNYPCPKCGEPLLTMRAYKMCVALKQMGEFVTKLTSGVKVNDMQVQIPMDMDNNGDISIKK